MTKLPKIFHNNNILSNNKKSYLASNNEIKKEKETINNLEKKDYFNYINKKIDIYLKDETHINGVVLSVQKEYILLNNGTYIKYDDIKEIK